MYRVLYLLAMLGCQTQKENTNQTVNVQVIAYNSSGAEELKSRIIKEL